ncbi:type II toxin-antitoxin system HicB family antitoxin [Marinobacter sp. M3C]|nr:MULTISPECIES: type II toxin-antitoxin system HicB family antitoxin [unclassified Marinobacter]MCL1477320.1 type II toxin-antitoxin system HicB family antitoxin [Marinobacter sp.]UQG62474.1 type II toxin-antitoxin system HicB family antitoxin [Marinobacter sp. M3C]MCL1482539.1 type II toxin-antitoxin system HicB family antitoxin [Marinobacter sp.]MCL1488318.1 type II toxin-antitoxin system HicB family antitoxin [Marinobacter sp.]UQG58176.1 type II toxin-antitoxin system HicB family antitoxin
MPDIPGCFSAGTNEDKALDNPAMSLILY